MQTSDLALTLAKTKIKASGFWNKCLDSVFLAVILKTNICIDARYCH